MDHVSESNPTGSSRERNSLTQGKLLFFPRRTPKRILLKYSLSVSLATVFLIALFVNQVQFALVKKEIYSLAGENTIDSNRIPANVRPEDFASIVQEQRLAKAIDSSQIKIISAKKLQSVDQFVYGTLQGKYRAQLTQGKIFQLQLSPHVSPTEGQIISDKVAFLVENRDLFALDFHTAQPLEKGFGFEIYDLQDENGHPRGRFRFLLDGEGHVSLMESIQ